MLHGDLSNEPVPSIGLRFEDIVRRPRDGKLNRSGKAFVESLAGRDLSILLFTTENGRKAEAYCYKWSVPYNRVIAVESILELIQVCQEHSLLQYWDTDKDILSKIHERQYRHTETKLWNLESNLYKE